MRKVEEVTIDHLEKIADQFPSIRRAMNAGFQLDNLKWGITRDAVLDVSAYPLDPNAIQPSKVALLQHCKRLWQTKYPQS